LKPSTLSLSDNLIDELVHSSLQIYPDATHSMSSARTHFYQSMETFFEKCFEEVAEEDRRRRR
jgi:hypothetical protein